MCKIRPWTCLGHFVTDFLREIRKFTRPAFLHHVDKQLIALEMRRRMSLTYSEGIEKFFLIFVCPLSHAVDVSGVLLELVDAHSHKRLDRMFVVGCKSEMVVALEIGGDHVHPREVLG